MNEPLLDGVWEREGRDPAVGAVVLVLGLGSAYFAAQLGIQAAVIVLDALAGAALSTERISDVHQPVMLAMLAVTQFGLFFFAALAVVKRWHTRDLVAYLRLGSVPWLGVLVASVGVLGLLPVVERLARFLYDLVPELRDFADRAGFLIEASGPAELAAVLAAVAITPAICEELVFRAYLQRTLERRLSAVWHVLLSGVFFALFHQQVLTLPSLVIVGVYLSFVYYAFRSPYPVVIAHLLYNASQVLLANSRVATPWLVTEEGFALPAAIGGLAIAGAAIVTLFRWRR